MAEVRAGTILNLAKIKEDVDLSAQIDGNNKVFTTPANFRSDHVKFFLNGIKVTKDADFTVTGPNEATFLEAPEVGDILTSDYIEE